jgi:L-asparaginase
MKPKIVLLATGGTIASRYDSKLGSTVASQQADELLKSLPQLGEFAEIEVRDFATIPSYQMSVQLAFGLAGNIKEILNRQDVAGVVVTHGTDTMEETSYLADLLVDSAKPAVFTGAQRAVIAGWPAQSAQCAPRRRIAIGAVGSNGLLNGTFRRRATRQKCTSAGDISIISARSLGEVDGDTIVILAGLCAAASIDQLEEVDLVRLVPFASICGAHSDAATGRRALPNWCASRPRRRCPC